MSSGNSRFRKGRERALVGLAKENAGIFETILWNRSAEKYDGGMRTRVKDSPTETLHKWARNIAKKDEFLVSTYIGGELLVITTKKRQWGYCTSDTPYAETLAKKHAEAARPFVTLFSPEPKNQPEPNTIVGLHGAVFEYGGRVAGSVGGIPPEADATPWEISYLHPATADFPAWADASVGQIRVRINPEIVQAPYHRLFDCLAFVSVNHNRLPGPDGMMAQQKLGGEDFCFWRTELKNGTVVMVDTLRRMNEFKPASAASLPAMPAAPRMFSEGQHRLNRWGSGSNQEISGCNN